MPRRPPPPTVAGRLAALLEQSALREETSTPPVDGPPAAPRPRTAPPGVPLPGPSPRAAPGPSGRAAGSGRPVGGWVPSPPDLEDDEVDEGEEERDDVPERHEVFVGKAGEVRHGAAGLEGDVGIGEGGGRSRGERSLEVGSGRHRLPGGGPRLVSVPESLHRARTAVSWPALVGVLGILVLAAAVFAVRVGVARAAAEPRPADGSSTRLTRTAPPAGLPTTRIGSAPDAATPTGGRPGPGTPGPSSSPVPRSPTTAQVVVDVAGLVVHPGVRALSPGARVSDALAAAGGTRPGADLARLNLARLLVDGEQLYVPAPGQDPPRLLGPALSGPGALGSGGTPGAGGTGVRSPVDTPVDLNTADVQALDGLPGVGPVLAQRIVDWRGAHGRFTTVDELGEVSGIGDKVLATLRPLVTL